MKGMREREREIYIGSSLYEARLTRDLFAPLLLAFAPLASAIRNDAQPPYWMLIKEKLILAFFLLTLCRSFSPSFGLRKFVNVSCSLLATPYVHKTCLLDMIGIILLLFACSLNLSGQSLVV